MLLVILVYLGTNLLFALAYLACGPGAITNTKPGALLDVFFSVFRQWQPLVMAR